MKYLEICFSPLLLDTITLKSGFTAVVCDIFRATTSFCTAFYHGVNNIIPIADLEEAKALKEKGFWVAGEHNGKKPDFADFGNDPFEFMSDKIQGKDLYYSTTNGTQMLLKAAKKASEVIVGSFLNIDKVAEYILWKNEDTVVCCSGWKGGFSFEDTLFSGALAEKLLSGGKMQTQCDSVYAALQLWCNGKNNLTNFVASQSNHLQRLEKLGKGSILNYAFQTNICPVLPVMRNEKRINIL